MKKQSILSLMKRGKHFLLLLLFLFTCTSVFSQSNPFLNSDSQKRNPYQPGLRSVLVVLDASGSMEDKIRGETKIHIAKRVLEDVITKADPNTNIGLRVYGASNPTNNQYIDCSDSKLLVIPGTNNRRAIISEIYKVLPRGFTPITYSLSQAVQDMVPYKGEKSIILISDGLETCGGDPCQLAQSLLNSGVDLKINVVGFGVRDNWAAQEQLMCIALNTNGRYYSAENDSELTKGLSESINKSVTGRIITMTSKSIQSQNEKIENLPILQPEKINLKNRK